MTKCWIQGCNNPAVTEIEGKPVCKTHAALFRGKAGSKKLDKDSWLDVFHPLLLFEKDPATIFIQVVEGTRESYLPLTYTVTKTTTSGVEEEKTEEKSETQEEIDWQALVGSEPIDELKHDIDLVLSAELAEREGVVTSTMLAKYLNEHPFSKRKDYNEDKARALLEKLAQLGIVKKKPRAGKRGQNIYVYYEGERSWRKM